MTEDKFEQAIENFFNWSWQTELIVCGISAFILIVVGYLLFKKKKKTAGWICLGSGLLVLVTDILRLFIKLLFT